MKKIVILGAGYAGILTAKKLERRLKKQDVSITLIDKNPFHSMLTELHEVAACRVDEDSIKMSLKKVFAGRRVNIVLDTIVSSDFDSKTVKGKIGVYEYDYLVLASGSKPTCFGIPGAQEYSHKLWSLEDAVKLKEHIGECCRKAAVETDIEKKKRFLSFYTIGAGFTGVEMAGELAEYLPFLCEKYEIDRNLITMYIVDALKRVCPIMPEKVSVKIEKRLSKMGVKLLLDRSVTGVDPDFIEIKSGDTVEKFPTNTVMWAVGIESSDIAFEAAKALPSIGRGRIKTDKFLRSEGNENVFVAGDNMFFVPEGEKNPVPQMVENCEQSSHTVAHNIVAAITGGKMHEYKPSFHGVMICVGGRYGAAYVGFPNHMFALPSFFAMLAKHFINIIYFIQVAGWNKVFSYLSHEFFTIRKNRSFLGGHFSNKTPSFLLFPLRLWLGAVWVFEGVKKIAEGWLSTPKLTGFFNGAANWFYSILGKSPGTAASDAVSSATDVAEVIPVVADAVSSATDAVAAPVVEAVSSATDAIVEAVSAASDTVVTAVSKGVVLLDWNLGLFKMYLVSAKDFAHASIMDYAFKIDMPIMNWFIATFITSSEGMQLFMQRSITIAEILLGLAIMGGLFTFPATALSLVLQFMFVCTTGLYLGTFWMIFAAIALLIGGGRTLGLDYYVMPALKKAWKKIPFIKKWYLYND